MPCLQNTHYGYPPWRLRTTLDRDINDHKITDTEVEHAQEFHHVNTNDFNESELNNPARLTTITRELDDLCQQVQAGEGQPSEALNHIEHKLQKLSISLHLSAPLEPLENMLKHYTDALCSAQKQTNFATSMLQDIPIFSGHDTTLQEDWLTDIGTVTDLTSESRTKLSQAKSKGLPHTLITEASTSGKSWDNINDLLHLKICNSNIHTSISHFMEFNKRKKNLSLHTYIILKERPIGAILQIMPQL